MALSWPAPKAGTTTRSFARSPRRGWRAGDLPGFVPAADLPLPGACRGRSFVYPSLFEGFGPPVLEAMACGVPVIWQPRAESARSGERRSHHRGAGRRGRLAHALRLVLEQPLPAQRATQARGWQAASSWRRSAEQTLAVYEARCSPRRRPTWPQVRPDTWLQKCIEPTTKPSEEGSNRLIADAPAKCSCAAWCLSLVVCCLG